ncbi:putative bifunctional diguanylate cyclase/phosphodiesterase [Neptuniibacter halophilus]|uniref:putative bifunctional diguanylate cyclase/phosphodiesterase n=1 Tax=Neptuniibacter halophilus TaxID=651666 RepID=UPI00257406FA|nr:bifunctional diguanylate cyclase/phosphodiesterase [Neptuniibacter halophilus]
MLFSFPIRLILPGIFLLAAAVIVPVVDLLFADDSAGPGISTPSLLVSLICLALLLMLVTGALLRRQVSQLLRTSGPQSVLAQSPVLPQGHELWALQKAIEMQYRLVETGSQQREANAELLDQLLQNSPTMIVIRDTQGRCLRANPAYLAFAGVEQESALIGKTVDQFLPRDIAESALEADQQVLQSRTHDSRELVFQQEGKSRLLYSERFPLFDENDAIHAVCTVATDLTARAEREKEQSLTRYIFESTKDGILVTDRNNRIVQVNPAFENTTGYSLAEVQGKAPNILNSHKQTPSFYEQMWQEIEHQGSWSGEIWNRKKSGEIYPEWLTVKTIFDEQGQIDGYFGVFTDISEQKKTEDSLRNMAYFDPLTNLANRSMCRERLSHDMKLADRHHEALALVFIDLDFFKHVNDSLGHEYGDRLLVEAAQRIQDQVRSSDTVVRWGGDEFILILPGIFKANMALVVASNVLDSLKQPFRLKNTDVYIGASIGIALYPDDARDGETLIRHADAAMYSAKSKGRDQICFFDPELNRKNLELIQIKADLRKAIEQEVFSLVYQPKVCLQSQKILGMEALLRWQREDGSFVSPADFIPVAERSGLIMPLGQWVMANVCKQVDQWQQQGQIVDGQRISVNLSPRQLSDPQLLPQMRRQFEQYPGIEQYLNIEITETAVIENIQSIMPVLEEIREMGLQVELDDFGSGYSSLNYLRQLPVDILKVDRTFTAELGVGVPEQAIMETIIKMAHSLDILVVAEGLETPLQLEILQQLGCDKGQGYLFSRPLAPEAAAALLAAGQLSL